MNLIADESVDYGIVKRLRECNYLVYSIQDNNSGVSDDVVLKIANEHNCLLITEDKDFGELTYRLKLAHKGILLIRLSGMTREKRIDLVAEMINKHFDELGSNFSVLSQTGLRIKKGHRRVKDSPTWLKCLARTLTYWRVTFLSGIFRVTISTGLFPKLFLHNTGSPMGRSTPMRE